MTSRHSTITAAFDAYEGRSPLPDGFKRTDPHGNPLTYPQVIGEYIRAKGKDGGLTPGETTRLIASLPLVERAEAAAAIEAYHEEKQLGRHGDTQRLLDSWGGDRETVEALEEGAAIDHVTRALIERRGSDGDRPLPELTRRDYLDAAIDAHSSPSTPSPSED
jgi:hypothetical protein